MRDNDLRRDIYSYFEDDEDNISLSDLRECIADKYDEIMNLDGSLMIDSIRILVNNIYHSIRDSLFIASSGKKPCFSEIIDLTNNITEAIPIESYNDKQYKEIYTQLLNSYYENRILELDKYISPVNDKNVYKNKSNRMEIRINLMLIRTVFNLLCEIDGLIQPREFYKVIDIPRIEYEAMISSGIADNKKLLTKLKKYHFPVSMFRGDNPRTVNVTPAIVNIVNERLVNIISEKEYIRKIKEQLFYVNSPNNAHFMLSMYSIYKDALPKK